MVYVDSVKGAVKSPKWRTTVLCGHKLEVMKKLMLNDNERRKLKNPSAETGRRM